MTTELNRDAPLYEAELPVRLVGEDAAVVEGERQLTIRLLEGTRPLGQTETPVPNSSDGAAGRERLLHLEVADAQDPYFLYALAVGEGDFHAMRREHALLVDFAAFLPSTLTLALCCDAWRLSASTPHVHAADRPRLIFALSRAELSSLIWRSNESGVRPRRSPQHTNAIALIGLGS